MVVTNNLAIRKSINNSSSGVLAPRLTSPGVISSPKPMNGMSNMSFGVKPLSAPTIKNPAVGISNYKNPTPLKMNVSPVFGKDAKPTLGDLRSETQRLAQVEPGSSSGNKLTAGEATQLIGAGTGGVLQLIGQGFMGAQAKIDPQALVGKYGSNTQYIDGIAYEQSKAIDEDAEMSRVDAEVTGNTLGMMGTGGAMGAAIGGIAGGPVGAAIGSVGGAILGGIGGLFSGGARKRKEQRRIRLAIANQRNNDVNKKSSAFTTAYKSRYAEEYGNPEDQILFVS